MHSMVIILKWLNFCHSHCIQVRTPSTPATPPPKQPQHSDQQVHCICVGRVGSLGWEGVCISIRCSDHS